VRLRTRVAVGLAAVVLAFVVTGTVVAGNQRDYLTDQVDDQLSGAVPFVVRVSQNRQPASGTGVGTGSQTGTGVTTPQPKPPPEPEGPGALSEIYIGRLSTDGTLDVIVPGQFVTGSPDISLAEAQDRASAPGTPSEPFTADGVDTDARFRVVLVPRTASDGDTISGWEVVALPLTRADDAYGRLLLAFAVGAAVVVLIASLIAWWVLRLGVRPIVDMTEAADAITAGDTRRRVPTYPPNTEAGTLAAALNSMLDQHDADEQRLRQFVADASHELRTPLTSIRGYAELYDRGGLREPAMLDDAMRRVSGEAARMGALVDDLLLLSNLDRDRDTAVTLVDVDVAAVLHDAAADARAVQPDRPLSVQCEPLLTRADDTRLRQVVAALVHNALVHTPHDAALELTGARSTDAAGAPQVQVSVIDHGPGLDTATAERVFERFFRGDASRSRHTGGSGLGLSIAESIVHAHGGTIALVTAPGAGCRFVVTLPAEPTPPVQPA
jgi:two-component system OmpR family sensor kinase